EEMNPLDVAFAYKGKLDRNDLTSMIIFLANLGYLSIEKKDIDYEIVCLKPEGDYTDEIGYISSYFYKSLYGCSYKRKADGARVVSRARMLKSFYNKGESILEYYNKEVGNSTIIKENRFLKHAGIFLGLVMVVFPLLMITYDSINVYKLFLPFFLTMWYGTFLFVGIKVIKRGNNLTGIILLLFALMHFVAIFTAVSYNGLLIALVTDPLNIYMTILSEGLAVIVLIMAWNMDKRTEYGNRLLGKLKGFRRFLETAEKDRLEALVEENPFYFFDILPYAYVLGVSKRWIQQFEDLVTSPPEWFSGYETFKYSYIESFVDYGLDRWQSTMNYKPAPVHTSHSYSSSSSSSYDSGYSSSDYSYSSSSSDSGGSSSGGGSGGGGGTSW
ncbi:MAG: DUF2207 domain-containing protein, partial [Erysipelotrichaceae bacterium]|nr:DUF2207 domain-containing protein [Erysipelotrichaceae bacterium]